jgi:signal transduction histidine kinase
MTALGKLFRTTAFKLTLVYLTIFVLFAAIVLVYFGWNTRRLINEQITQTVDSEIVTLQDEYDLGGIRRLIFTLDARARRPDSYLYLLTTAAGEGLAGNVGSLTAGVLERSGWTETAYRKLEALEQTEHHALVKIVQLSGGFRMLVGRDLEERDRMHDVVIDAGRWSLAIVVILGIAGGLFVMRRVLQRVDAMTATAQTIMAGDLSERLPIARTGDELDRLAGNLNTMLDRIEALMRGLKEVSDNIAHDLKTPLTRLRNRCEEALRTAEDEAQYRAALEGTIEESDGLIQTFNALLMIARAESGQARDNMRDFDAAEVAHGVGELYEPLAEEKGLTLSIDAPVAALVRGNRELISQALANLVDNSIKYAVPDATLPEGVRPEIRIQAASAGDRILLTVADRGPGIPEADRTRVLERFVRLEQSRSQPGSGLGLSLALAVAHLHGGDLKLEDNQPGLRTVISLPRVGPVSPAVTGDLTRLLPAQAPTGGGDSQAG